MCHPSTRGHAPTPGAWAALAPRAWAARVPRARSRPATRLRALAMAGVVAAAATFTAAAAPAAVPLTRAQAVQALAQPDGARRLAALERLAEVGAMGDAARVAERLKGADEAERVAAEVALWAIWSRSGHRGIDQMLSRGSKLMHEGELGPALMLFSDVVRLRPAFAEGWNKRATVLFMLGRHEESLRDCAEVLARNPLHFGALSGMAQIHLRLGDAEAALRAYERALQIHPGLPDGARNLQELEHAARQQRRAAGAQRI